MSDYDLDMTQPERTANAIRADLKAYGVPAVHAKHAAEEAKVRANRMAAALRKGARSKKIDIGESPTVEAVKDAVLLDPEVSEAFAEARDLEYVADLREVCFENVKKSAEMFKSLCYLSSRVET